jgi:hypothetical protein
MKTPKQIALLIQLGGIDEAEKIMAAHHKEIFDMYAPLVESLESLLEGIRYTTTHGLGGLSTGCLAYDEAQDALAALQAKTESYERRRAISGGEKEDSDE